MGPTLILDKSSLQSLSADETFFLNKYFLINIPPILLIEILGDLKKTFSDNILSEEKVVELSKKLIQYDSAITAHFNDLINGSLLGFPVEMDGRPIVAGAHSVQTNNGKKGFIFEETPEEEALSRWRIGKFTEAEYLLSERWRKFTKGLDLEGFKKEFGKYFPEVQKLKSLKQLNAFVDALLENPAIQTDLIKWIVVDLSIDFETSRQVFTRWELENFKLIMEFAPYAYFCFRANLFFYFGLVANLIGTRATNKIDLEYLYYLPFCHVFSSNDNFHQKIAEFFLTDKQSFVRGEEIKSDLHNINKLYCEQYNSDMSQWGKEFGQYPPRNTNSIVYNLWMKHVPLWNNSDGADQETISSNENHDKQMDKIKEYLDAEKTGEIHKKFNDSDTDFIVKKRKIWSNELCPCGSGKIFRDCCWDKVHKKN